MDDLPAKALFRHNVCCEHSRPWRILHVQVLANVRTHHEKRFGYRCVRRHKGDREARKRKRTCARCHSSGGGLCQWILNNGPVKARGLALVGAIPNFGRKASMMHFSDLAHQCRRGVYWNWFKLDLWCVVRCVFHLLPPNRHFYQTPWCTIPFLVTRSPVTRFENLHNKCLITRAWPGLSA